MRFVTLKRSAETGGGVERGSKKYPFFVLLIVLSCNSN